MVQNVGALRPLLEVELDRALEEVRSVNESVVSFVQTLSAAAGRRRQPPGRDRGDGSGINNPLTSVLGYAQPNPSNAKYWISTRWSGGPWKLAAATQSASR